MGKALIVEDSKQIAEVWKMILSKEGFTDIVILYDGSEVEKTVQEFKPELVFMDINLPGNLDGLELTARIQSIDNTIPVLILSLNHELQIFQKAFANGARGYIVKNSSITEIKEGIHAVQNGEKYICSEMKKYASTIN